MPTSAMAEIPVPLPEFQQVIDVLQQAGRGPDALADGMRAIGYEVRPIPSGATPFAPAPGDFDAILDLWLNGQPVAVARCTKFGPEGQRFLVEMSLDADSAFDRSILSQLGTGTAQRVFCFYDRWGPEESLAPFLSEARIWGEAMIGPASIDKDPSVLRGQSMVNAASIVPGIPWAMRIMTLADGPEAQISLRLLFDLQAGVS